MRSTKKLSTEDFILRASQIHKNRYDYSLVEYKNMSTKVIIICPIHGNFLQTPQQHLRSSDCSKCSEKEKMNKDTFIAKSLLVHGNRYDYSKVEYFNNKTKVCIICREHGEFWQKPNSHLRPRGCPKCKSSNGESSIETWLQEQNIKFIPQKRFEDCKNIKTLPFDFYLPKHNICIEYDGEQHFQPVRFRGIDIERANERFQRTQINDKIKTNFCKENSIKLLRIPYFVDIISCLQEVHQGQDL